jgi:hypothetical protein
VFANGNERAKTLGKNDFVAEGIHAQMLCQTLRKPAKNLANRQKR